MKKPAGILENSVEGVGCVPQAQTLGDDYDWNAPNCTRHLQIDALPDFEPDFGCVTLEPRAVVTDLIECPGLSASYGIIVSPRFRAILEAFPLQPHRWVDVPVAQRVLRKPKEPPRPVGTYHVLLVPYLLPTLEETASKSEVEAHVLATFGDVELVHVRQPRAYHGLYVGADLVRAITDAGLTGLRFRFARMFR